MNKITSARQLRKEFWKAHPNLPRKKITNYSGTGKMYCTDVRVAWTDWKDSLNKDDIITQELATNTSLSQ